MKKLIAFAAICLCLIAATYFTACNNQHTGSVAKNTKEDSLRQVVERGSYLANHVAACIHCHSKRDFTRFAGPVIPGTEGGGGDVFDNTILEAIPGTLYGKNITPDKETGIGNWTDDEVLRAITHGIRKNGDTLFPIMPYVRFNKMAKDDLLSIVAYLRTLQPIHNKVKDRQLMIPISMAYPASALQHDINKNVRPDKTNIVNYGAYLTTVADCATCHTPFVKGQADNDRYFAGGNTFHIGECNVTSANLTSDSATGLGSWTEERFLNKFTIYRDKNAYSYNPGKQNTVIALVDYSGMTDVDLKAIYAFLRTIPAVHNPVDKYPQ